MRHDLCHLGSNGDRTTQGHLKECAHFLMPQLNLPHRAKVLNNNYGFLDVLSFPLPNRVVSIFPVAHFPGEGVTGWAILLIEEICYNGCPLFKSMSGKFESVFLLFFFF